jgi:7-cyano-7-deazaguanine synthase
MMTKALVVLSGGQDSTTCLFWAIAKFGAENVHAISFDYGQRHDIELESARKIAVMAGLTPDELEVGRHEIIDVRNLLVSTSPLTSGNQLDRYENFEAMEAEVGNRVEKTFVPMRNTLFLTIAANRAVALGCRHIVTGICQADNANYPDCTNPFKNRLQAAFNSSLFGERHTKDDLVIDTPLMFMSKAESVKLAMTLPGCMDALAYSHTSYDGKYPPTDPNHSNLLRAKGFEEAGVPDPLVVRAVEEGLMSLPSTANYAELQAAWDADQRGQDHGFD